MGCSDILDGRGVDHGDLGLSVDLWPESISPAAAITSFAKFVIVFFSSFALGFAGDIARIGPAGDSCPQDAVSEW